MYIDWNNYFAIILLGVYLFMVGGFYYVFLKALDYASLQLNNNFLVVKRIITCSMIYSIVSLLINNKIIVFTDERVKDGVVIICLLIFLGIIISQLHKVLKQQHLLDEKEHKPAATVSKSQIQKDYQRILKKREQELVKSAKKKNT
ncbi:hypothetical protein [Pedobacter sp.]|uniref:hypothetical protein n=1 Tax=Pedobacter sp. TaxID=1411316 RepID=UPI003D7F79AC